MAKKETRKTTGTSARRSPSTKKTAARKQPSRSAKTRGASATATTVAFAHEQVAERARKIWEERGCPQGQDEQNWREAERQLQDEMAIR